MADRHDRTRSGSQLDRKNGGTNWKMWVLAIAVVIFLVIVIQNSQSVDFKLLFVKTQAPLILLLAVSALIGAALGYLAPIMRRHRLSSRKELRRLEDD